MQGYVYVYYEEFLRRILKIWGENEKFKNGYTAVARSVDPYLIE